MTTYVILAKSATDGWHEQEKQVEAASARAAIREALDGADEGGEFVAVPLRSWEPVKVEVQAALKFL